MKVIHFVITALVGVVMFWLGLLVRPSLDLREQQEASAEPDAVTEVPQQEPSVQDLAAQGYLSLETLQVRIDDGEIQWYDGTAWHTAATVEEMEKEDKFYAAQENFREFEEQMKAQQEVDGAGRESAGEQGETLLVGQKPEPTAKPRSTKPAVTTSGTVPVPAPEPTATPENAGGGNSGNSGSTGSTGGGNPGGGNSGNSGSTGSTGGGNPGGGNSGNTGDSGSTGGGNPGGGNSGNTGDSGNSGGGNPGGGDNGSTGDSGNTGGGNPGGGDSGNSGGDNSGSGDSGNTGTDTGDGENMEWSDDYL